MNKCKEEGYPVTSSGLYYAGEKYGFLIKKEGNRSLEFDKDKARTDARLKEKQINKQHKSSK